MPLILPAHAEWEDPAWREETGWTGTDLCHSPTSPTHIVAYWWDPHAQTLTGLVRFNPNAGQLRHQASHGHSKHFEHRTDPPVSSHQPSLLMILHVGVSPGFESVLVVRGARLCTPPPAPRPLSSVLGRHPPVPPLRDSHLLAAVPVGLTGCRCYSALLLSCTMSTSEQ